MFCKLPRVCAARADQSYKCAKATSSFHRATLAASMVLRMLLRLNQRAIAESVASRLEEWHNGSQQVESGTLSQGWWNDLR
mmetsp:Transcript_46995/g.119193  ORF Transcript_46995/g.119193 Transcript_46995/m.119193 type:complete len:81 (-) Transcript_46995:699-941(-)